MSTPSPRVFIISMVLGITLGGYIAQEVSPRTSPLPPRLAWHTPTASPDMYRFAFSRVRPYPGLTEYSVRGLTVNHHLLAPDIIADTLATAKSSKVKTIVLLSPNHFYTGYGKILTSNKDWATPFGLLAADAPRIQAIAKITRLNIENPAFEGEHGVYNIVPFIKHDFPYARIIPIIVKSTLSVQAARQFADQLNALLPPDTLVVASVDFSHYKTSAVADANDAKTLEAIRSFNSAALPDLDLDAPPAMIIMLRLMANRGATSFRLLHHTNSAKVIGNLSIPETTSYIDGVFTLGRPSSL